MRFADTLVLFIIGIVLFSPLAAAAPTVVPNKTTYVPNDKLVVTGVASPSSTVTVKVLKPNGNLEGIDQGSTNAAGAYNITVLTWPSTNSTATPFGTYTITVTDSFNSQTAQQTVTFAGSALVTTTNTTTTSATTITKTVNNTITKSTTVTSNKTVTSTATTTTTSTTTSLSSTTITSTATSVTTTTSVSTQVSTVVSTATATTVSTVRSTVTSTVPGPASTTTVTSEVPVGLPAEVTYAAIGIAVIAIIAAALLATRRRR